MLKRITHIPERKILLTVKLPAHARKRRTNGNICSASLVRSELNKLNKSPQILRGSFSAVWTATIARVVAFFTIFRDLQDLNSFAPLRLQNFGKKRVPILVILKNYSFKTSQNFVWKRYFSSRFWWNFFGISHFFPAPPFFKTRRAPRRAASSKRVEWNRDETFLSKDTSE